MRFSLLKCVIFLAVAITLAACTSSRNATDEPMLHDVALLSDNRDIRLTDLEPYIRQQPQVKWFIRKKDVPLDSVLTAQTAHDLTTAMQNMGYLNAATTIDTTRLKHQKVSLKYHLHPGEPFHIRNLQYDIRDDSIAAFISRHPEAFILKEGMMFSVNELNNQRKHLTTLLNDNGYYRFHKDFITFTADSTLGSHLVDLTLKLSPWRVGGDTVATRHPVYYVRNVNFAPHAQTSTATLPLRPSVLRENTAIRTGEPYSAADLQKTYNNFARLSAVRYTNVNFSEDPDTTLLDCLIHLNTNKPNTLSFQPEGTNTAGDFGAAASLTYENRNLFHGSEVLTIQLRGAFEAITGLEDYQNQDYKEYSIETKLLFPRLLAPLVSRAYRRRSTASSELSVSYNLQDRPEFHRRLFNGSWRYRWTDAAKHHSYRVDLLDLNYIHMPWISPIFKQEYLDAAGSRNAILRYNYEDLFIMKIGFATTIVKGNHAIKLNVETAGNLLSGISRLTGSSKNNNGQYTLFNIAYAQYAKADFDYSRTVTLAGSNQLALHAALGVAWPYANSRVLPFEKRYFSGGANSVRGWTVRGLGPGKFRGNHGAIDFINQTGDMKLDLSMEYRTHLFWKLAGALFIDAGNIWTMRNYPEQEGGQFHLDNFYEQIAVAYGAGLRLNFSYFILRFDMGMKAVNPAYENAKEHWAIVHPRLSRDFAFHFAVGLPF